MTPEQEAELIAQTTLQIQALSEADYNRLIGLLDDGMNPLDAVRLVLNDSRETLIAILAAAFSEITETGMTTAQVLGIRVGNITLSERLYANAAEISQTVQSVVTQHVAGFQNARTLALELYEGYGFRPEEPLRVVKTNRDLPKYLREILTDPPTELALSKAFETAQSLRTRALRAAYLELIRAIDNAEAGPGKDFLENKLKVAFEEKNRYYATRIARTELHRAYALKQAEEIMADSAVYFVEWRLNPIHPADDICDYFAGLDKYGLGRGIYPKALAPVAPAHPHCRCVLVKRLDIRDKPYELMTDADLAYFNTLPLDEQRKVAGTAAKLERVKAGESAWDVHNDGTPSQYQVKTVQETLI